MLMYDLLHGNLVINGAHLYLYVGGYFSETQCRDDATHPSMMVARLSVYVVVAAAAAAAACI